MWDWTRLSLATSHTPASCYPCWSSSAADAAVSPFILLIAGQTSTLQLVQIHAGIFHGTWTIHVSCAPSRSSLHVMRPPASQDVCRVWQGFKTCCQAKCCHMVTRHRRLHWRQAPHRMSPRISPPNPAAMCTTCVLFRLQASTKEILKTPSGHLRLMANISTPYPQLYLAPRP